MSDRAKPEFSLDQFSETEADEQFGLPDLKEHFADPLTPAVLRDWSARDFSSIYVRFRPHLEAHAKRFLANPSQVEEVIQDAFLYLMTSLPELDSELGVLRFLKWKVRLLALDVIRANSRTVSTPIEAHPDLESNDPEISQGLERAEEAAIVALALAKLSVRQREAIIATLYEDKPTEVVASQMGLSANAFRQLLFRARTAFKSALIGDLDTRGLAASQILSIAVRKAAQQSGRGIISVLALISFLGGITFLASVPNPSSENIAQSVAEPPMSEDELPKVESGSFAGGPDAAPTAPSETDSSQRASGLNNDWRADDPISTQVVLGVKASEGGDGLTGDPGTSEVTTTVSNFSITEEERALLLSQLDSDVVLVFGNSLEDEFENKVLEIDDSHTSLTLATMDNSVNRLNLGIRPDFSSVEFLFIENKDSQIVLAPRSVSVFQETREEGRTIQIAATDFLAGDLSGQILNLTSDTSTIFGSYLVIQIHVSPDNLITDSQVLFKTPMGS